ARIQIPSGSGTWPAFWMMGSDFTRATWPSCGEIDVMETIGGEPRTVHGTIHGPGGTATYTDEGISGSYALPTTGPALADAFHVYAVEWDAGSVRFSLDGHEYKK